MTLAEIAKRAADAQLMRIARIDGISANHRNIRRLASWLREPLTQELAQEVQPGLWRLGDPPKLRGAYRDVMVGAHDGNVYGSWEAISSQSGRSVSLGRQHFMVWDGQPLNIPATIWPWQAGNVEAVRAAPRMRL